MAYNISVDFPSLGNSSRLTPSLNAVITRAMTKLQGVVIERPKRRDDLDQCHATITTVLKRMFLLLQNGLENKSVLLLGDDDLLSVALSVYDVPFQVTVVDIDSELLRTIKRNSDQLKIKIFQWDLRNDLPADFTARYDMVFTDPPYTLRGQLAFLRSAILALRCKRGSSLFFCASRLYLNESQLDSISHFLRNASLQHERTFEDFNEYEVPPDVLEDIKRRRLDSRDMDFRSTLFQYVAGSLPIRPHHLEEDLSDIYSYDSHNVAS